MSELEVVGLSRRFGGHAVLENVSFRLAPGEFFALLGPSGSGKTTLLRLIAGLDQPAAGAVRLGGQPATLLPPERRRVAVVFQQPLLFPHLSVAENVGFGLRMRGVTAAERERQVAAALAQVQLPDLGRRYPTELSGGQQQRVALARALVVRPRILLLDEPFSHLDPGLRQEMRRLLRKLQRESAVTTLLVTHDHDEALQLADRLGVLLAGRLVQTGPPATVLAQPASRAVASFMQVGNLLPGGIAAGIFTGPLGSGPLPDRAGGWPDGPAWAVVPPERLALCPPGRGAPTEVVRAYPDRGGHLVEVVATDQTLTVRLAADAPIPAAGAAVGLTWASATCWYVYE